MLEQLMLRSLISLFPEETLDSKALLVMMELLPLQQQAQQPQEHKEQMQV
jgi:hypothetical protein